jgi:hypothetical protein
MNPMLMQQLYVQALSRQLQPQVQPQAQPSPQQNPLDVAYHNLIGIGMSHEQAIAAINGHIQSQQQPVSHQMTQGDQLTNNSRQEQGRGTASAQYPDGASHD